jgi:transcriptional regulator with XRE-family HTH domain
MRKDAERTPSVIVGDNIRAEMARQRVTQQELGRQLGLTGASVSRRLTGLTPFTIDEISRIAGLLKVTVEDLVNDTGRADLVAAQDIPA